MRAILLPVKSFAQVKQRLAQQLELAERISLVRAMCSDVFACVATLYDSSRSSMPIEIPIGVPIVDRVFVVSSEPQVLDDAKLRGWGTIREVEQRSESASVDFASAWCAEHGITALLRLPIDLPLVTAPDIQSLFASLDSAPSAALVPSRDGTGTNALLRSPPVSFPSRFGPGSFARHLAEAERVGARVKILRNPRIEFDVDDPADLLQLPQQQGIGPATLQWLRERGLFR